MKMEWKNAVLTYGVFTPPSLSFAMRLLQQIKLIKASFVSKLKELTVKDEIVEENGTESVENEEEMNPVYTNEAKEIQIYRIMKHLNREDEFIDVLGIVPSPSIKVSEVDILPRELVPLSRRTLSPRFTLPPPITSRNNMIPWYRPYNSLAETRNRLKSRGHVRGPRRFASVIETLKRFVN